MGIGIKIGISIGSSLSSPKLINLFDYDTVVLGGDGRGTVSKEGGGVVRYTVTTVGAVHGFIISSFLEVGNVYRVTWKSKSDTITGDVASIGDNANKVVANSNPSLTTLYQNYDFTITPTQTACRFYFGGTGSIIGSFIDYKDIAVNEV